MGAIKRRIDDGMHALEHLLGLGGTKKDVWLLAISGVALLASLFEPPALRDALPVDPAWVAIILCGVPIICEAIIGLVTEFDITADVLVAIALIASVAIGETFAAGEVAFIMQLGGLLEELTVARARAGIERLVHLTPQTARRIARAGRAGEDVGHAAGPTGSGGEETIPAEQVGVDDLLRVLPGETVPVDGVIVAGATSIDQAVMTGESMPVDKGVGDEVFSGTINRFGSFDMRATKVGEDSSIQRMIRLVQSADAGKAKIVSLADRWAVWIVVIAISAALITWAVTGEILRAVTILVVFCPCALVLATPTAIMAAIGNATKHGFLVREGDALERLAGVRRVAFDKTGTLTCGEPRVVAVECARAGKGVGDAGDGVGAGSRTGEAEAGARVEAGAGDAGAAFEAEEPWDEGALLRLAACAELRSEHPLGKAIVAGWRERAQNAGVAVGAARSADAACGSEGRVWAADAPSTSGEAAPGADALGARAVVPGEPENFSMLPGRGVEATCRVDGARGKAGAGAGRRVRVIAGNRELMAERGLELPADLLAAAQRHLEEGCTVTYVACVDENALAGAAGGAPAGGADTPAGAAGAPAIANTSAPAPAGRSLASASAASPHRPRFGLIALADTPRPDAAATIGAIRAAGVEPVLLTGDNPAAASSVAGSLGITEVRASCRPQDKLAWIDAEQGAGWQVCMVGDGVNDAPALKRAHVGVAMGGIGSDIAVDAADIVLVNDDLRELPHLLRLSRRMMATIKLNLTFSMTLNFVAIALAITGILNPVVGALVHNAGSVAVIVNSALLLRWRPRGERPRP